MKIFKVYNDTELTILNEYIDESELQDGSLTAIGSAKKKKENFQITNQSPDYEKFKPYVLKAHYNIQVLAYTFMKKLLSPRISIYKQGSHYDWHVDNAIMDFDRADLSFTIFLNSPSSYNGGELELELNGVKASVKGKPGEIIIYASGTKHRVLPIKNGERRVIVGWLRSNIQLQEHRDRLYNMNIEISKLRKVRDYNLNESIESLNAIYQRMVRDYSN